MMSRFRCATIVLWEVPAHFHAKIGILSRIYVYHIYIPLLHCSQKVQVFVF